MKSVCIIAKNLSYLNRHIEIISRLVKNQLENPDDYRQLEKFWNENHTFSMSDFNNFAKPPENIFKSFFDKFQANVSILWKYSLLNKRLLFFDLPQNLGKTCNFCNCCLNMTKLTIENVAQKQILKVLFYVNVNEMEFLENESSYVACTTDRLYETKSHLYDLLIYKNEFKFYNNNSKISKINKADQRRFQDLKRLM